VLKKLLKTQISDLAAVENHLEVR